MATEIFLNIDDKAIAGESIRSGHEGEIDILSFKFAVHHEGQKEQTGGKVTQGRAEFSDVVITKHVDKSSPKLMQACASGQHFTKAVITMRSTASDGDKVDFYIVTFNDLIISSFDNTGQSDGDALSEEIMVSYSKVGFKYTVQGKDGNNAGEVTGSWNVKTNAKD